MLYSTLVLFHVCNAVVGILSGFLAMVFRGAVQPFPQSLQVVRQ